MRRLLPSLIALVCLIGPGMAQTATVKLTAEDTHVIKEIVLKETRVPRTAAADYKVGDQAPAGIALQTFPEVIEEKISAAKSHRFFVSGDKVVLVNPKDNTIAEIVE